MKTTIKYLALISAAFFLFLSSLSAQTYIGTGNITEVLGESVTLYIADGWDKPNPLSYGDKLEFTREDGVLEFSMGTFQLGAEMWPNIQVHGLQVSIPPEEGMSVKVYKLKADKGNWLEDMLFDAEEADASQQAVYRGEVMKALGNAVEIRVDGSIPAGLIDAKVEIFYITSSDSEISIGEWKVSQIKLGSVFAIPVDAFAQPKKGMRATIYTESMSQ